MSSSDRVYRWLTFGLLLAVAVTGTLWVISQRQISELNSEKVGLQRQLDGAQADYEKQVDELKRVNAFIVHNRERLLKVVDGGCEGPRTLRTVVAAIQTPSEGAKPEFLTLSIGSEAGVQEGEEFLIYRDSTYICKARVEKTLNDLSHARIIASSWSAKNLQLQLGDQAASH